jgi:hypothetical protein
VVDADVRIYVQEVRAVHTVATDGGMRPAVRLPGMRRAFSPCHPDRARLPHHVGRSASGRRKVRAHHRKIRRARPAAILAPSWIVQEGETCQGESVSASLTESRVASSLKHRRAASGYCASDAGRPEQGRGARLPSPFWSPPSSRLYDRARGFERKPFPNHCPHWVISATLDDVRGRERPHSAAIS